MHTKKQKRNIDATEVRTKANHVAIQRPTTDLLSRYSSILNLTHMKVCLINLNTFCWFIQSWKVYDTVYSVFHLKYVSLEIGFSRKKSYFAHLRKKVLYVQGLQINSVRHKFWATLYFKKLFVNWKMMFYWAFCSEFFREGLHKHFESFIKKTIIIFINSSFNYFTFQNILFTNNEFNVL
jgi:hypothetical protein